MEHVSLNLNLCYCVQAKHPRKAKLPQLAPFINVTAVAEPCLNAGGLFVAKKAVVLGPFLPKLPRQKKNVDAVPTSG